MKSNKVYDLEEAGRYRLKDGIALHRSGEMREKAA
jgi:hypothetical protein